MDRLPANAKTCAGFGAISKDRLNLMAFLYDHAEAKFSFTELNKMRFFSSSSRLSNFLVYAVRHGFIKKTVGSNNNHPTALYEIRAEANDFIEKLKLLLKE